MSIKNFWLELEIVQKNSSQQYFPAIAELRSIIYEILH